MYILTYELIQFLFVCVCFQYNHLDTHIHKIHHLRASPICIAAGRVKHLHKFALTRYPWKILIYTPYFTGIPPHVILMLEIESLKATFEQQTRDIVQEMRIELNERNVCGNLQKSECVLGEIKATNEYLLSKFENLSGKYNNNYYGVEVISNNYFVLDNVIDQQEELEIYAGGSGGGITPPYF